MEHVFCTVLSRLRVYQGLALLYSLRQLIRDFRLYILCVDDSTFKLMNKMRLKEVRPVSIGSINAEGLYRIRKERRLNEYCWTLKPLLIEHVFLSDPSVNRITYLDADLYFYADPSVIFEAQPLSSVLLTEGQIELPLMSYNDKKRFQSLMGRYNSGFISFFRDHSGLSCLKWWKERCLESCACEPAYGRFGDQRYLDEMPYLFRRVESVKTPGVNIGHWNSSGHNFSVYDGCLYIDSYRLICYHFSGYRIISRNHILTIYELNRARVPFFYKDYTSVLQTVIDWVDHFDPLFEGFSDKEDLEIPK